MKNATLIALRFLQADVALLLLHWALQLCEVVDILSARSKKTPSTGEEVAHARMSPL